MATNVSAPLKLKRLRPIVDDRPCESNEAHQANASPLPMSIARAQESRGPLSNALKVWAADGEFDEKVGTGSKVLGDLILEAFGVLGISDTTELAEQLRCHSEEISIAWMGTRTSLLESVKELLTEEGVDEAGAKQLLRRCAAFLARALRRLSLQVNGLEAAPLKTESGMQQVVTTATSSSSSSSAMPRRKRQREAATTAAAPGVCTGESPAKTRRRLSCKTPDTGLWPKRSNGPQRTSASFKDPPESAKDASTSVRCAGHYDILKIIRNATAAQVRTAYRRQALKTHPDKGGDPEDFRQVVAAFEALSDQVRRALYDGELDKTGCPDGCEEESSHSPSAGAEAPENAEEELRVLGQARVALHVFTRANRQSEGLREQLREMGDDLLQNLAALLKHFADTEVRGRTQGGANDPDEDEEGARKPKTKTRKEQSGLRNVQRFIARRLKSNGSAVYFVRHSVGGISIITKSTDCLEEAIDWHVALTTFKTRVDERRRAGQEPFAEDDLLQVWRSAPRMKLKFFSQIQSFPNWRVRSFVTPTTFDLDVACHNLHHFTSLKGKDVATLAAARELEVGKIAARNRERQRLQRQLKEAVSLELQRRDLRCLPAAAGPALLQLSPSASSGTRAASVPLYLASQEEPSQSASSSVSTPVRRRGSLRMLALAEPQSNQRRSKARRSDGCRPTGKKTSILAIEGDSCAAGSAQQALPDDSLPACVSTRGSWLPGLRCTPGLESCFDLTELCRLRCISSDARRAADEETCGRLRMFTVRPEDWQRRRRTSTAGRVINKPFNFDETDKACRLKQFLVRHRNWFVSLDLSTVSLFALELPNIQATLSKMPRLEEVIAPWEGWGTPAMRNRFLQAVPRHVTLKGVSRGVVVFVRQRCVAPGPVQDLP